MLCQLPISKLNPKPLAPNVSVKLWRAFKALPHRFSSPGTLAAPRVQNSVRLCFSLKDHVVFF